MVEYIFINIWFDVPIQSCSMITLFPMRLVFGFALQRFALICQNLFCPSIHFEAFSLCVFEYCVELLFGAWVGVVRRV